MVNQIIESVSNKTIVDILMEAEYPDDDDSLCDSTTCRWANQPDWNDHMVKNEEINTIQWESQPTLQEAYDNPELGVVFSNNNNE